MRKFLEKTWNSSDFSLFSFLLRPRLRPFDIDIIVIELEAA